jgi:hypothetical protein
MRFLWLDTLTHTTKCSAYSWLYYPQPGTNPLLWIAMQRMRAHKTQACSYDIAVRHPDKLPLSATTHSVVKNGALLRTRRQHAPPNPVNQSTRRHIPPPFWQPQTAPVTLAAFCWRRDDLGVGRADNKPSKQRAPCYRASGLNSSGMGKPENRECLRVWRQQ